MISMNASKTVKNYLVKDYEPVCLACSEDCELFETCTSPSKQPVLVAKLRRELKEMWVE